MSGYIGNIPVPQATQTRQTFTATASQTTFNTIGYTPRFLDVFLNGVKLVDGTDFTATNGSDVVLTTGAASGDTLDVVAYTTFDAVSQNFTGGVTVDNDGATVLTVDRATSDGTIIDVQKDGSTVGSIGSVASGANLYMSAASGVGLGIGGDNLYPVNASGNSTDGALDIGDASARFKDLYLSGGVYLGGTGAANKLDDYETGTWTGTATAGGGTVNIVSEGYIKIGDIVHVVFTVNFSGASGSLSVYGLPFAATNWAVGIGREDATSGYAVYTRVTSGNTNTDIFYAGASGNATPFQVASGNMRMSLTYSVG